MMNRFKFLVGPDPQQQQQLAFDRTLTNRIKKFSSERNLFFANVYSNTSPTSHLNHHQSSHNISQQAKTPVAEKQPSRLEKTKSFCGGGLLKKCKSLRDLYQQRSAPREDESKAKSSFKHMDEFERNYLFRAGKRDLVRELRKNFETGQRKKEIPVNNDTESRATYRKCDFSEITDMDAPPSNVISTRKPPRHLTACHSFNITETSTSILRHELNQENARKPYTSRPFTGSTTTLPEMSSWTRSEMDLSSLARPPIPVLHDHTDETMQSLPSEGLHDDPNHSEMSDSLVLTNNQRNHQPRIRSNDGDTMSLCDMSLYPIYMQNINDNNNLAGTQKTEQGDSGISLNNNNITMSEQKEEPDSIVNNTLPAVGMSRMKKYSSVNQIDLEVLKNELDDFVDISWKLNTVYHHRSTSSLISTVRRKELDLEQKIDLEIKMREGSAKLLAACNQPKSTSSSYSTLKSSMHSTSATSPHNTQMLEAAKNLLTSNERMTAYMAELQRRKKRDTAKRTVKPSGKVSLSEIRMPLMWRDTDHFKNKGDHRRFAVFCLAKIDTEIYDTSLLCPVDRNSTDISFNDAILFTNVPPDFELKLEIYSVMMEADLTIASTPRKIKNTIHSSISRTVGKRLAANLKDELNNTKIGPKFELIASATLTLDEASDLPHTHDLTITPTNTTISSSSNGTSATSLPLFGHFCCRLAVQPDSIETPSCSGEITLHAKGPMRSVEGFARLQAFQLELWEDEASCEQNIQPRRTIEVIRDAKVKHRNTVDVLLNVMEEGIVEEYTLHTQSEAEALRWFAALKKAIKEHAQWGHVTVDSAMQLAVPANYKHSFLRGTSMGRQRSLYDQVPILENRQSTRPTSQDVFAVPNSVDTSPTLNDFRLRTNSSSGRSSSHSSSISIGSSGSRKSHWPFGSSK